jgi:hypothetical protein
VDIDRIVLTGLDLTPDRAEHIRTLVEAGLRSRLQREGWARDVSGNEVTRLEAPGIQLAQPHSDGFLADALTRNIAGALRTAGARGAGRGHGGV